jgi:hypothetical protein
MIIGMRVARTAATNGSTPPSVPANPDRIRASSSSIRSALTPGLDGYIASFINGRS